jgi:hypothetical protein
MQRASVSPTSVIVGISHSIYDNNNNIYYYVIYCSAVAQWLRNYATKWKFPGSIPDEVIFLNLANPSGRNRPWGLLSL